MPHCGENIENPEQITKESRVPHFCAHGEDPELQDSFREPFCVKKLLCDYLYVCMKYVRVNN